MVHTEPDGESLTMEELVSLVAGSLIAAGHETTTGQLGLCVKNLLQVEWSAMEPSRDLKVYQQSKL